MKLAGQGGPASAPVLTVLAVEAPSLSEGSAAPGFAGLMDEAAPDSAIPLEGKTASIPLLDPPAAPASSEEAIAQANAEAAVAAQCAALSLAQWRWLAAPAQASNASAENAASAAPGGSGAAEASSQMPTQRAQAEDGILSKAVVPPPDRSVSPLDLGVDKTLPSDLPESQVPDLAGARSEAIATGKGNALMPHGSLSQGSETEGLAANTAPLQRELQDGTVQIIHSGASLMDAAPHGSPGRSRLNSAPLLIESAALLRSSQPMRPSPGGAARQSFPALPNPAELSARLSVLPASLPGREGLSSVLFQAGETTETLLVAGLTHSAQSRYDDAEPLSPSGEIAESAAGTPDAKPPINVKTKDKLGAAGEERFLPDFEPELERTSLSSREREEFHAAFDLGSPAIATMMLGARDVERGLPASVMPVANGFHTPSEHVLLQISKHATEFQQFNATSMAVVLKPDADTALFLHLKMQDGQVQVFARFERGNYEELQSHWGRIQQSLQSQGIVLAPLENGIVSQTVSWSGNGSERNPRRGDRPPQREEEFQWTERPARPASPRRARSSKHWESWA